MPKGTQRHGIKPSHNDYPPETAIGVKKDLIEARTLYLKAASYGDKDAQNALERMMAKRRR